MLFGCGCVWCETADVARRRAATSSADADTAGIVAGGQVEVPVEHGLLMENLLDLAHAPFTHTSTFAKGWPVPDSVKFKVRSTVTHPLSD